MFNHPNIFLLLVCLFEFFPLCFIYVVPENEAIYKVFGLAHFSWNKLWRVAIDIVLIINSSLHHVNRLSLNSNAVFVFVITSLNALSHVECH